MHLTLSPQSGLPGRPETTIHVTGDVITIDGTPYDLSAVPEGGEGHPEGETPFVGPIRRIGGVIHATILVRLGDTCADHQPSDPAHWVIPAASGSVTIPAARKPAEVTE